MDKIGKILWKKLDRRQAVEVLKACFNPFGSLSKGVDGEDLAEKLLGLAGAKPSTVSQQKIQDVKDILAGWDSKRFSTPENSVLELDSSGTVPTLVTPTSGTKISASKEAGTYTVSINFGEGSAYRARQIILPTEEKDLGGEYVGESDFLLEKEEALQLLLESSWNRIDVTQCGGVSEGAGQEFVRILNRILLISRKSPAKIE